MNLELQSRCEPTGIRESRQPTGRGRVPGECRWCVIVSHLGLEGTLRRPFRVTAERDREPPAVVSGDAKATRDAA
jgi:hypothetical protein